MWDCIKRDLAEYTRDVIGSKLIEHSCVFFSKFVPNIEGLVDKNMSTSITNINESNKTLVSSSSSNNKDDNTIGPWNCNTAFYSLQFQLVDKRL